ncbi:MAG: hypothetical protein AAFX00_07805, partial [Pseudomonadota bacterium]
MNAPLTPESQVNSFVVGNQTDPEIATLSDGSYVVVWTSEGQDGDGLGVIAQKFTAAGEPIGLPFIVNDNSLQNQQDPSVAATDNGGFVVVWESQNLDAPGDGDFGIAGQAFLADGTPSGSPFQVNLVNTVRTQFDADVIGTPGGGFAVVYRDEDSGGTFVDGTRLRLYDNLGQPTGADVALNASPVGEEFDPEITAIQPSAAAGGLVNGGFAVTWAVGSNIFAKVLATDGTEIVSQFQVNSATSSSSPEPVIVGLDGGRFVVVWRDSSGADSSGAGVFAQVYEGDGTAVGGEFQVNVLTSSTQSEPAVAATADGGFVISWSSNTSAGAGDGNLFGIIARR